MMKKKQGPIIAAIVLLLLIGGVVWAVMRREDPQFVKLDKMRGELMGPSTNMFTQPAPADMEKRMQAMQQFQEEMQKLPPEQQQKYMEKRSEQWQEQMMAQQEAFVDDILSSSPAERDKKIDELISMMERGGMGRGQGGPGGRGGGGFRGGFGMGGPRGGGGGAPTANYSRTEGGGSPNVERSRNQLNRTSPQMRAKMDQFGRMMNDRMSRR